MAAPYTSQAIAAYNDNPPPDDGSTTEANRLKYATTKTKLADPIRTLAEGINSAVVTAFTKIIGGGGITSTGISYQVLSTDQGKLIQATAASITVTTPDATDVDAPFIFALLNQSSGTITLDGSGSQTVNGNANAVIPPNGGCTVWTDGSNWFAVGLTGTPVGKELHYGNMINATIAESNATNAVTYSLKTLAGTDPTTDDPVLLAFRSATAGSGVYVYRTVTAALSLTISSGSTLGTASATAARIWLVLFDDGGTIRLGAINCRSGVNIYPLGRIPLASSTAEGGAGAADSAHVFYTGTAVTSKPYLILGYCDYPTGIATAGSWNASPARIQLFGNGVPLPGAVIQTQGNTTGAVATGTTVMPLDDSIPQNTEGDEYMTQAITPVQSPNILEVRASGVFAHSASSQIGMALFQDTVANALSGTRAGPSTSAQLETAKLEHTMLAVTESATTFKIRAGGHSAGTTTFNGISGARIFGGVMNSYITIDEIMA